VSAAMKDPFDEKLESISKILKKQEEEIKILKDKLEIKSKFD
jgi:hypothetical protein